MEVNQEARAQLIAFLCSKPCVARGSRGGRLIKRIVWWCLVTYGVEFHHCYDKQFIRIPEDITPRHVTLIKAEVEVLIAGFRAPCGNTFFFE